jgi:phospholipid/cholesterol/gamma-HCH transport system substrate-binding protein
VTRDLGSRPLHRLITNSAAAGLAGKARRHFGSGPGVRQVAGLLTVATIGAIVAVAAGLFRGSFTSSVLVTVVSPRAGLVMNPDAKVKMRDIQVGKVASIESLPNGRAALHLAMYPSQLHLIPANVLADIASSTVFGAKFVELVPPADPSPQRLHAGQTLDGQHVTVEMNTVFDQLTSVLSKIEPDKLNETLGAIASALSGRGANIGQTFSDLDSFLAKLEPSLPALSHDIAVTPVVANAYADAATDLIQTLDNTTEISQTIVDEQQNLDALLVSTIGLADIGNDVLGTNSKALTTVLHLLVPSTDLTNRYHEALTCGLAGIVPYTKEPPLPYPGIYSLASFLFGSERYRYPVDLPKVAAKGGPQCVTGLPNVPYGVRPPFVVADVGSNPWRYGNQQLLLNSDLLKQLLYGPIDGPPRNSGQIGQPG